jgi:hypothetical protein
MEKRVVKKVEDHVQQFKTHFREKALALQFREEEKLAELMEFVYEYQHLQFDKDDFLKRKRVKNSIPELNRCIAKRANGEQCTRKRKEDCEFCGTHHKGTPHGSIRTDENDMMQKMEVFAEEISGIVYYLDKFQNVYKTEDILSQKENPSIIAKWEKRPTDGHYTIPSFGLV